MGKWKSENETLITVGKTKRKKKERKEAEEGQERSSWTQTNRANGKYQGWRRMEQQQQKLGW